MTFVTALQYLETSGMAFGDHMAVAMVAMESPAVLMAVAFANMLRQSEARPAVVPVSGGAAATTLGGRGTSTPIGKVLHESFTDVTRVLLLGAMAVGFLSGDAGRAVMQPFSGDLFKGMLAFFLLDMGTQVAKNFGPCGGARPCRSPTRAFDPSPTLRSRSCWPPCWACRPPTPRS